MKKQLLVGILIVITQLLSAQSRLTIRTANESDFLLLLDQTRINNVGCISIGLDNLPAGKHELRIEFPRQPEFSFQQTLTLKKNTAYYYDIELVDKSYKFVLKSESSIIIPASKLNQPGLVAELPVDSVAVDSLKVYENSKCKESMSDEAFEDHLQRWMEIRFEEQKLDEMKAVLTNTCITAEQLNLLLGKLSMEENKLEFLSTAIHRITNPSQMRKQRIESNFYLERNRKKALELIATLQGY